MRFVGVQEQWGRWAFCLAAMVGLIAAQSAWAIGGDPDADGDAIVDSLDNCVLVANTDQVDADADGIGNACDPDLNQDCTVNFIDIAEFSGRFLSNDAQADFNGDGVVNFIDYVTLTGFFLQTPGPSGISNLCSDDATLVLSGFTAPVGLDGAIVSAVFDQTVAGGSVSVVNAVTNPDGSYEIVLNDTNPTDFVTLAVAGIGGQTGISLGSLAGSVAYLAAVGGNDGTVNATEAASLRLSPVSTAFSVLAAEELGSDVSSDADLGLVEEQVDASRLADLATLIDAIILDSSVALPAGITDTLTLVSDVTARARARLALRIEQPAAYAAALERVFSDDFEGFTSADAVGQLTTNWQDNFFQSVHVVDLVFGSGNSVELISDVAAVGTWSVGAAGELIVTFPSPVLTASGLVTIEDPSNPGLFIETEQQNFLDGLVLRRVREGLMVDVIDRRFLGFFNYPDFPQLGNTRTDEPTSVLYARLMMTDATNVPFSPMELAGVGLAAVIGNQNLMPQGSVPGSTHGLDTLEFNGDGTGTTRRSGLSFTWQILSDGRLEVSYPSGDTNTYRRHFLGLDNHYTGYMTYQVAGGSPLALRTFFIPRDEMAGFTAATLEERSYRHGLAVYDTQTLPDSRVFDFVLSAGGDACRNPDSSVSTWTWALNGGRVDIFRSLDPTVPGGFFNRTWQPLQIVGDRYWVLETLQIDFEGGPVADPAVTPGRLNVYTFVHDNAGNLRPTLMDDAVSTPMNTPVTIYTEDLFANDSDPEGDELILRSFVLTTVGGVIESANPSFGDPVALRFTPDPGFTGVAQVTIEASDLACRGLTAPPTSTLFITVN